jgi:hypothetical protein
VRTRRRLQRPFDEAYDLTDDDVIGGPDFVALSLYWGLGLGTAPLVSGLACADPFLRASEGDEPCTDFGQPPPD